MTRCTHPRMQPGDYLVQTTNRLRPGQTVGTLYPCGPGVLRVHACLKCVDCGHSVTKAAEARAMRRGLTAEG